MTWVTCSIKYGMKCEKLRSIHVEQDHDNRLRRFINFHGKRQLKNTPKEGRAQYVSDSKHVGCY